ncbi:tail assembly protein [Xanthomonas phage FoX4]|uniref:Tail assembly protein n=1 Tax=Xanthomonas phage FoX4 TaxID=2723900 RepID=A0A858WNA1_9CAUD|nr:tail assembly protein [Xanthomonas phage FoX4]QJI52985.1 tail assembly protein [Xanthomonas phage FoX4]
MTALLQSPDVSEPAEAVSDNLRQPAPRIPPAELGLPTELPWPIMDQFTSRLTYTAAPPVSGPGHLLRTPHYDWYYGIYILPASIDLGNLGGDTQRVVYVWNAFLRPAVITSAQVINGAGITFTTTATIPGVMAPLQQDRYTLNVPGIGTPEIDAIFRFDVDGQIRNVPIIGRRVVTLPFAPNWKNRVTETLTWVTSLLTAYNGDEQVKDLANPRRSFSYSVQLTREDAQLFDLLTFGWVGRMYAVPIWNEGVTLQADANQGDNVLLVDTRYFSVEVGSTLMIRRSNRDYDTARVESFTDSSITLSSILSRGWKRGEKVYPLMIGQLPQTVSPKRLTDTVMQAALSVQASPSETPYRMTVEAPAQLYRGAELYLGDTNWRDGMDISNEARDRRVDNSLGIIRISPKATYALRTRRHSWMLKNKVEIEQLRRLMVRRGGRRVPIWMNSGTSDFFLRGNILQGDKYFRTDTSEYATLIANHPALTHLMFFLHDGTRLVMKMEGVFAGSPGQSNVFVDTEFPRNLTPADVKRISYLALYRLGGDAVDLEYATDSVAEITLNLVLKKPL